MDLDEDYMVDLAAVDHVAVVYRWLRDHPRNHTEGITAAQVSGIAEPPWPHVVCSDGPGGAGMTIWGAENEVQIEVVASPAGEPSEVELRRLALLQVALAMQLPDTVATPGAPVVSRVRPSGVASYVPRSNGQPVYTVGVLVVARPAPR